MISKRNQNRRKGKLFLPRVILLSASLNINTSFFAFNEDFSRYLAILDHVFLSAESVDQDRICSLILLCTLHCLIIDLSQTNPIPCHLIPFTNKPWCLHVWKQEKEKWLVTSNFSFSPTVFSSHLENFLQFFIKFEIFVLKHIQFGRV